MSKKEMNRRDFLQASGLLGAGCLIGGTALVSSCGKKTKNVPLREAGTYYIPELPDKIISLPYATVKPEPPSL